MSDRLPDIHPESRALFEENALLREELAHLLATEHDLVHITKPNLLALYQKKIGAWELRVLHAQTAALRARRKLEMAQAAINQNRAPDWAEIDARLELEFLTWQQKIAEAAERLNAANHRLDHLLPAAEDRELKKLYYALVKKLHPDLHPELRAEPRNLWRQVQAAYERGDIEELRALSLVVEKAALPSDPDSSALDALRRERDTLNERIAGIEQRIGQLEAEPPFTMRDQLADETWLAARRDEIEARIAEFDSRRAALEKHLQHLLPPLRENGQIFGPN